MRIEERKGDRDEPGHATEGFSLPTAHSPPPTAHSIRLGPPWQITATESGTRHARKFGRPRTLDVGERLWLVCAHVPGAAEVRVNGTIASQLESAGPFACDITAHLRPRNDVVFTVASPDPLGGVALEIRTA